jgi:hypothetical protein
MDAVPAYTDGRASAAVLASCEEKTFTIWPGLSRLPRISNGEHVVSESAKFIDRVDCWKWG